MAYMLMLVAIYEVFLVARKMGFGTLHRILEENGEQPNRWLRNKAHTASDVYSLSLSVSKLLLRLC